jgi:hypothetical protein
MFVVDPLEGSLREKDDHEKDISCTAHYNLHALIRLWIPEEP